MFHQVKRRFALAHQPLTSSPPAEFADLRQRLSNIKSSLKQTSASLDAANRHWIVQIQDQRRFSDRFHQSYPTTTDDTYHVAAEFAQGSQVLYDKFVRESSEDLTAYNEIHKQVLVYIAEIETLEKSYSTLMAAKSETERYQSKVDFMERSRRKTDEGRKERNLQKMDNEREQYKKLLVETVERQKVVYAKHPVAFKAALTAYWLSHEKHVNMLVQSLEQTQRFAKRAEQEMRELDIANWTPEIVEESEVMMRKRSSLAEQREEVVDVTEMDGKAREAVVVEEVAEEEEERFHSTSSLPLEDMPDDLESPTNVFDTLAGPEDRKSTGVTKKANMRKTVSRGVSGTENERVAAEAS